MIATTEKVLTDGAGLINHEDAGAVRQAVSALNTAKDGNDPKVIRARMAELEQAAKPLSVAMVEDSLKRGLHGKKVSEVTKR